MSDAPVYGIDLGTTYSCIAYVDAVGKPVVIPNDESELVTPSVVYFESAANVIVGKIAQETARVYPDLVVELIKRNMGDSNYRLLIYGREYRPEEISALILRRLREDAERHAAAPVTDVVITVPAYFNEAQRTATEQAGQLAGLNVRAILPEPTAAAIAYALTESRRHNVLVYDLGGGTFDVTVMQIGDDSLRVVCIGGDHQLGGRDWDEHVVRYFSQVWKEQTGRPEEPLNDAETAQQFLTIAERAKRSLTRMPKVPVSVSHAGAKVRLELTREKFDELTGSLLERTATLTRQTLAEAAARGVADIDRVILVGGSTYMPQVAARLRAEIGRECELFDPELAVAKGAALYAANKRLRDICGDVMKHLFGKEVQPVDLSAQQLAAYHQELGQRVPDIDLETIEGLGKLKVVNACSKNFGVVVLDEADREVVAYLIHKNDQVPAEVEREFYTRWDGQAVVEVRIIEAEGAEPLSHLGAHCREIKRAFLNLPSGLPRHHPIAVNYSLSEDGGRLHVVAADRRNGRTVEVTVETVDALSPQDLADKRDQLLRISVQ